MESIIGAFIGGMITVISPGGLLILPAVLLGYCGSRFRSFAIVTGMATGFTIIVTISLGFGSIFSFFVPYIRQFFALFVIGIGAVLLNDDINQAYVNISNSIVTFWRKHVSFPIGCTKLKVSRGGPLGGLLLGISLGAVLLPPIDSLDSIISAFLGMDDARGGNLLLGVIFLLIYSLGFSVPMLLIAYLGKTALSRVEWFVIRKHFFRKLSGLILILTGFMVFFGVDKYIWFQLIPYLAPYNYSSLMSRYQLYRYFFI